MTELGREPEVEEKLWTDPDWNCPRCEWVNFAVRSKCRNCGFDSWLVSGDCYFELNSPTANLEPDPHP